MAKAKPSPVKKPVPATSEPVPAAPAAKSTKPAKAAKAPKAAASEAPATPSALGFRMPAEWEPQEAVWL